MSALRTFAGHHIAGFTSIFFIVISISEIYRNAVRLSERAPNAKKMISLNMAWDEVSANVAISSWNGYKALASAQLYWDFLLIAGYTLFAIYCAERMAPAIKQPTVAGLLRLSAAIVVLVCATAVSDLIENFSSLAMINGYSLSLFSKAAFIGASFKWFFGCITILLLAYATAKICLANYSS